MQKAIRSTALLTLGIAGMDGLFLASEGQAISLAEFDLPLQQAICGNDWNRAIKLMGPMIGDPEISSGQREQLLSFRHRLQDWQASRADASNIAPCENIPIAQEKSIEFSAPPGPLNFAGAMRSLQEQRSMRRGEIVYEGQRGVQFTARGCWVIDAAGRRIDLSSLCAEQ
jgi:hypothetical protein